MRPSMKGITLLALLGGLSVVGLCVVGGGLFALDELNDFSKPPTSSQKTSLLRLPDGMQVRAEETTRTYWEGPIYQTTFRSVATKAAIVSLDTPADLKAIKTGRSRDVSYFLRDDVVCLHHKQQWKVWLQSKSDAYERFWREFQAATGHDSNESNWDVMRYPFEFRATNFEAQGKKWTITLAHKPIPKDAVKYQQWSQGLIPPALHLDSTNSGDSWRLRESITPQKEP